MGALDDGYSLSEDSIKQLRDDHNLLSSMVRSAGGRRTVLYPPQTQGGGGGGGGGKIWFTVLEIDYYLWILPGCERVRAVVTQVSCETTAVAVGDEVYIYDPVFCYFNVPIVILMQLRGTATLSKKGSLNLTACGLTVPDCFWAVDSVHCLEEEYAI